MNLWWKGTRSATRIEVMANPSARSPLAPLLALLSALLLSFSAGPGSAQPEALSASDGEPTAASAAQPSRPRPPDARESRLSGVLAARRQIEADLLARQKALGSDGARGREEEIEAEIRVLSEELADLNRNFSELASGVDPISIELDQVPEELNLMREVRDLLGPLVNELKRATSRPREIDRLRTEISELASGSVKSRAQSIDWPRSRPPSSVAASGCRSMI